MLNSAVSSVQHTNLCIECEKIFFSAVEPTLTGPKEKEVKVEPNDDVTLTCDIDVLPLNITWTVHGTVIKGKIPNLVTTHDSCRMNASVINSFHCS